MARSYHMTYVPAQKRWTKFFRGKSYSVSCRQLGCQPGKDASWLAANVWWERKQQELEAQERAAQQTPEALAAGRIDNILSSLSEGELRDLLARARAAKTLLNLRAAEEGTPHRDALVSLEAEHGAVSAIAQKVRGQVEEGRTVREQVEKWLAMLRLEVQKGEMQVGRFDSYRRHVKVFETWLGGDREIASITAPKLEEYYAWLSGQTIEGRYRPSTANTMFMTARQFIRRLGELAVIPLPGNVNSRRFRFNVQAQEVERLTLDEVRTLLAACDGFSERTKLYLLLCLNCGMYQSDVSDLGVNEVDWKEGVITRSRSKTPDGPKVRYRLWPETFSLLMKHRATQKVVNERGAARVLLTDEGKPLVRQWLEDGKARRYDIVQSAFSRLWEKAGLKKPIKLLRKTSASELGAHPEYSQYVRHFLAQSPKGVADRHYVKPSDERFFEALAWLRGRYFVGDPLPCGFKELET